MVIRTTDEDPRLFDVHALDQIEVLFVRADPSRDFGKLQPQFLTGAHRFLIFFGIHEKLRLPHQPLFAAQTRHQAKKIDDLLHRERRHRLLTVAERRIGHPNFFGHVQRDLTVIERDFGHRFVIEQFAVQVRFLHILQSVFVNPVFQQVKFFVVNNHVRPPKLNVFNSYYSKAPIMCQVNISVRYSCGILRAFIHLL